jgi:hypothetical protein
MTPDGFFSLLPMDGSKAVNAENTVVLFQQTVTDNETNEHG